jgi:hypothetical protein
MPAHPAPPAPPRQSTYAFRKLSAPVRGPVAVNLIVFAASLANLAAMLFARGAYRRRRVAAHAGMRVLRLAVHTWSSVVAPERGARWWIEHALRHRALRPGLVLTNLLVGHLEGGWWA